MMTQINLDQVKALFTPLTEKSMLAQWSRLHAGDCEPLPTEQEHINAWLLFHNGDFQSSANLAQNIAGGQSLRIKALATYNHYLETDAEKKTTQFKLLAEQAETALQENNDSSGNLHYQIAYNLGRYGQFISVAKALTEGIAGKIYQSLKQCLVTQPNHADAHTALATYQAEIIGKLGKMAAKLTYSVSSDDAMEHYGQGVALAPFSVSAKTEQADGILSIYGKKQLKAAVALYQSAVEHEPIDALEALDYTLAKQELEDA